MTIEDFPGEDERTPGEIIRARLKELGRTQEWLAEATDIQRPNITKIIGDREYLGPERASRIALALEIPTGILLRAKQVQLLLAQEVHALSEQAIGAGDALARIEMKVDLVLSALDSGAEPGQAGP